MKTKDEIYFIKLTDKETLIQNSKLIEKNEAKFIGYSMGELMFLKLK